MAAGFVAYRASLEPLRGRVGEEAFRFFAEADIHDAELPDLRVIDSSRPAPLGEPARPWQSLSEYPVRVELTLLDAHDENVWRIVYSTIRSVVVDFPSNDPLFNQGLGGFDDLGYHELTDASAGFLRHEVLFSSGAVLAFEFKDVVISSIPARPVHPKAQSHCAPLVAASQPASFPVIAPKRRLRKLTIPTLVAIRSPSCTGRPWKAARRRWCPISMRR
jgi:hypothetical protein